MNMYVYVILYIIHIMHYIFDLSSIMSPVYG